MQEILWKKKDVNTACFEKTLELRNLLTRLSNNKTNIKSTRVFHNLINYDYRSRVTLKAAKVAQATACRLFD